LRKLKIVGKIFFYLIGVTLVVIFSCNVMVIYTTSSSMYEEIEQLPENRVGLVLGTSDRLVSGDANLFFKQRIEVAAMLFKSGKIKHIIVSGDNRTKYYNEPLKMKNALVKAGVPEKSIVMDFAGLRTLDSMIRGKLVFGQHKLTVITQSFHSYRAMFIGKFYGMEVVSFKTKPLPEYVSLKVKLREIFARTVAVWDLYIIKRGPRHLGKKIDIIIED